MDVPRFSYETTITYFEAAICLEQDLLPFEYFMFLLKMSPLLRGKVLQEWLCMTRFHCPRPAGIRYAKDSL